MIVYQFLYNCIWNIIYMIIIYMMCQQNEKKKDFFYSQYNNTYKAAKIMNVTIKIGHTH